MSLAVVADTKCAVGADTNLVEATIIEEGVISETGEGLATTEIGLREEATLVVKELLTEAAAKTEEPTEVDTIDLIEVALVIDLTEVATTIEPIGIRMVTDPIEADIETIVAPSEIEVLSAAIEDHLVIEDHTEEIAAHTEVIEDLTEATEVEETMEIEEEETSEIVVEETITEEVETMKDLAILREPQWSTKDLEEVILIAK